eukprot:TRINITY_DN12482_c0_g1_i1.p1 TRINITY_DN12482_c0_g1~~TRINITY_DN12482_c0_g1_i1.p1  ORF type:complete len:123 (-),score=1.31 TRINITY_DN12482_c0_g1_i1:297-665(-)
MVFRRFFRKFASPSPPKPEPVEPEAREIELRDGYLVFCHGRLFIKDTQKNRDDLLLFRKVRQLLAEEKWAEADRAIEQLGRERYIILSVDMSRKLDPYFLDARHELDLVLASLPSLIQAQQL